MSDNIQQVKEDISFIKGLASDDGTVLLASGIGLILAGTVFGLMALRTFLIAAGWVTWPEVLVPLMPYDGIILFFAIFVVIMRSTKGGQWGPPRPGATSRAMWAAWAGVGISYLITQIGLSAAGYSELARVSLFAFWGGGWFVLWAIYRHIWMIAIAVACYVVTILAGLLWGSSYETLLMALGFFALVALPGVFVVRQARAVA